MWRDLRGKAFILTEPRCPCYCGGEGMLILVACPKCGAVMGRCDEVEELIRDVTNPVFDGEESICHANDVCPLCGKAFYGQFRAATASELQAIGLSDSQYRPWSV